MPQAVDRGDQQEVAEEDARGAVRDRGPRRWLGGLLLVPGDGRHQVRHHERRVRAPVQFFVQDEQTVRREEGGREVREEQRPHRG